MSERGEKELYHLLRTVDARLARAEFGIDTARHLISDALYENRDRRREPEPAPEPEDPPEPKPETRRVRIRFSARGISTEHIISVRPGVEPTVSYYGAPFVTLAWQHAGRVILHVVNVSKETVRLDDVQLDGTSWGPHTIPPRGAARVWRIYDVTPRLARRPVVPWIRGQVYEDLATLRSKPGPIFGAGQDTVSGYGISHNLRWTDCLSAWTRWSEELRQVMNRAAICIPDENGMPRTPEPQAYALGDWSHTETGTLVSYRNADPPVYPAPDGAHYGRTTRAAIWLAQHGDPSAVWWLRHCWEDVALRWGLDTDEGAYDYLVGNAVETPWWGVLRDVPDGLGWEGAGRDLYHAVMLLLRLWDVRREFGLDGRLLLHIERLMLVIKHVATSEGIVHSAPADGSNGPADQFRAAGLRASYGRVTRAFEQQMIVGAVREAGDRGFPHPERVLRWAPDFVGPDPHDVFDTFDPENGTGKGQHANTYAQLTHPGLVDIDALLAEPKTTLDHNALDWILDTEWQKYVESTEGVR